MGGGRINRIPVADDGLRFDLRGAAVLRFGTLHLHCVCVHICTYSASRLRALQVQYQEPDSAS